MTSKTLSEADHAQLTARGLSVEEAENQLSRFRRPPNYARLIRPATVGDGIEVIDSSRVSDLVELHRQAADSGRFAKFVPASGAASRMFRELLYYQRGPGRGSEWAAVEAEAANGGEAAGTLRRFVADLDRFAFRDQLAGLLADRDLDLAALAAAGRYGPILDGLLEADGLDYRELPKGLLAFHRYAEGPRTPFEEHLVEAAGHARGPDGRCVLHLTVSPEHMARFQQRLEEVRNAYESRFGVRYAVDFSVQKPSTDMLAVDLRDDPFRDAEGRLRFRPGGHGSLIENLNELDGDLIYIKNIDNVQPDHLKDVPLEWKRVLGGLLVQIQRSAFESVQRLSGEKVQDRLVSEMLQGVGHRLHVELNGNRSSSAAAKRRFLLDRLNRPIRVCGVVRNTGEPGGGPFWVRSNDGTVTLQIVEASQVDPDDEEQQQIFEASTHFNPVDLVCGVRDGRDRSFDLHRFVDSEAVTISVKSSDGHDIKAQERPGLWNGAMAGWNTIFVEVPLQTFSPVKSVVDLLRPEHQ
jgi:hypothetical protein